RLLDLGAHESAGRSIDIVILTKPFNARAGVGSPAARPAEGGEQGSGESSGQTGAALETDLQPQAASLAQATAIDPDAQDSSALAAAVGFSGLLGAPTAPQSHSRGAR